MGAHSGFRLAISRGDQAYVDRTFTSRAHRAYRAFLDRPQEFSLRFRPHLGDLIEEEGAALSSAEKPEILRVGAAEGAPLVAKELTFNEVLGDRCELNAMTGALFLLPASCSARATSSFPVPLSPTIRTVPRVFAAASILL